MRIEERVTVAVDRDTVFDFVTDPANYTGFMEGITRWEVAGDVERGLGARYRMLVQIGSAQVGGLIEVVEWEPGRQMAWSSVTGIDQRGRWLLSETEDGGTRLTFRFAYGVAGGGFAGMVSERIAARSLRPRFRRTLQNVKRQLEARRFGGDGARRAKLVT